MSDRPQTTLDAAYFDRIYADQVDPWGFETREYEREKYARTIASLPRHAYLRGLEIGCSVGVLTGMLSRHCTQLVSTEINEKSLARARERNHDSAHRISFRHLNFPQEDIEGTFDLVVLSEVAYYWASEDFQLAQTKIVDQLLEPGGTLILVHYTPTDTDYPMTGDEVHEAYLAMCHGGNPKLGHVAAHRAELYRIDVFERMLTAAAEPQL